MQPGTLVTPNVRLVRPLGEGGMGSVWVAEHLTLDTEVAVKFIADDDGRRERSVERFRREASLAARLKNPHVVKIFDHGVAEGGAPYIVMELLSGESLADRLARTERLTPRETVQLVSQVAKLLSEAHELDIVHRDLKPSNLFLVDSGYELFVKVLDFGIAKRRPSGEPSMLTDSGTTVGTPHYMSPEALMSSRDVDHGADLWSLAVVAYHALTGKAPFEGETFASLSVAIHESRFRPPSSLCRELTADIDAWFKVALCRQPAQRYATAGALAKSFRQACATLVTLSGEADDETLPDTARASDATRRHTLEGTARRPSRAPRRWLVPAAMALLVIAAVWAMGATESDEPRTAVDDPAPSVAHKTEPMVVADDARAETEASAKRKPRDKPSPKPSPSSAPSAVAKASATPVNCAEPFTVDEHGDLVPRPECFRH